MELTRGGREMELTRGEGGMVVLAAEGACPLPTFATVIAKSISTIYGRHIRSPKHSSDEWLSG